MPPNMQNCREGERWDAWKGQCVPDSPLASALSKGGGQTGTPPTSPGITTPPTGLGGQGPQRYIPPTGDDPTQTGTGVPPGGALSEQLGGGPQRAEGNPLQECYDRCAPGDNVCRQQCEGQFPDIGGGGADRPEDCTPPMTWNWVTGQCIDPNAVCPGGQQKNPITQQCQEVSDPSQCQPTDTWSIIEGRCIPAGELGSECDPETQVWNWMLGRCVNIEGSQDKEAEQNCINNGGTWYGDPLYGGGGCNYTQGDEPPEDGDNPELEDCNARCEAGRDSGDRDAKIWFDSYAGGDYATCLENCRGEYYKQPCPKGQTRDEQTGQCFDICEAGFVWDAIRNQCIPEGEDYGGGEDKPDCPQGQRWDTYRGECVSNEDVVPGGEIVPPTPDEVMSGDFSDQLWQMLSQEGWAKADEELWQAKMSRLDEQYKKSEEQLEENLNVRGLYYSGARADALGELTQEREREDRIMAGEHENEMYNRRLQQLELASTTALGARSLDIKYALGKGELTIAQISLALQETLGMSEFDIQQQGLDLQMLNYQAELAYAEAQTQIQRDSIRLNVISMLFSMGIEEEKVMAIWAQIAGSGSAPAI